MKNNLNISFSFSQNEKCFRQIMYRKSKHILHVQYVFFSESPAVYEIMWRKYCTAGYAAKDNKMHVLYILDT